MKNWKTSLAGIAAAALSLFANGTNWKNVLAAAGISLIGLFAGDSANTPVPPKA